PDEEAVAKKIEPDRVRPKSDLRVAGRGHVGVAVSDHRDDPGHFDDDLVPLERRDPRVQARDGGLELFARHRMEEVPMPPRHLVGHDAEVLPPSRNVVRGDGGGQGGGGEEKQRGESSKHAYAAASPSRTMRPSRISTIRPARRASDMSCVITTS